MNGERTKKTGYHTEGNVIYLLPGSPESGPSSGDATESGDEVSGLQQPASLTSSERTALERLKSSVSSRWTPARLHAKIRALGLTGERAEQAYRFIVAGASYDTLWSATREITRRLDRGYGEQRIILEMRAAGYDGATIDQALSAVSEQDWIRALDIAGQSSSVRSKEGPAQKQALLRRGFSASKVQNYLKGKEQGEYR